MDKNILVVEDDAQVREGVRDILEANGYTVYEAFNEKTAMIHLMSENMQTVILDINLGDEKRRAHRTDTGGSEISVYIDKCLAGQQNQRTDFI